MEALFHYEAAKDRASSELFYFITQNIVLYTLTDVRLLGCSLPRSLREVFPHISAPADLTACGTTMRFRPRCRRTS
jgi:hypothetical protein